MQEFDKAELKKYDGSEGRPVYVAYKGKVYDVSDSKLWRNALHMKRHHAAQDLTADIQGAPHEPDVLDRFPLVGTLKKEVVEIEIPQLLAWVLAKAPMLRRHPHPMTVHFPIVFVFATAVFNILYIVSGLKSFEITALHCLGGGILFTAVGIATGFYTWWLNYFAEPLRAVKIKIPLTLTMLTTEIIIFVWRITVPDVLDSIRGVSIVYLLLVLALIPMITVIGWFGASMTFPIEKD
jgi:predicted heme/steroid binding protein/uncharacterized membrane protein